jgi:hypothetical protein
MLFTLGSVSPERVSCYRIPMPGSSAKWRCWSRLSVKLLVPSHFRRCCRRFRRRGNEPCSHSHRAAPASNALLPSRSQKWPGSQSSTFRRPSRQCSRTKAGRLGRRWRRRKSLPGRSHCRWRNRHKTKGWKRFLWWQWCRARPALDLTRCNPRKTRHWNPPERWCARR